METIRTTADAVLSLALDLALDDMKWLCDKDWYEIAGFVGKVQSEAREIARSRNEVSEPYPWEVNVEFFSRALGGHVMDLRSRLLLVEAEMSKEEKQSDHGWCLGTYIQMLGTILTRKEDYAGRVIEKLKSRGHVPETPV